MSSSPSATPPSTATITLDVVCLCAAWCGTCGEYEAVFKALQAALPAHRYRWVDIEDESELVGDIDVETFPTLMVARQGHVLFAGPVLPRLGDAQRLIETLVVDPSSAVAKLPVDQWRAFEVLAGAL
ncbi:MAG: thioredoxin [Rubrivivax sp.]|nr:MAG: thioredoxin [Rubrivivax sp.]